MPSEFVVLCEFAFRACLLPGCRLKEVLLPGYPPDLLGCYRVLPGYHQTPKTPIRYIDGLIASLYIYPYL